MRFQKDLWHDEPEINLIPLIDVLLVILIFLTATTTFTRTSMLAVNLPSAAAQTTSTVPQLAVDISASGAYAVNGEIVTTQELKAALARASASSDQSVLIIYADAQAAHQAVVDVMQAAQAAGIARLSFGARSTRP